MQDLYSRFFNNSGPFPIYRLVQEIESWGESCKVSGNEQLMIKGLASLSDASETQLSFFSNPKYRNLFSKTKAGACFVKQEIGAHITLLVVDNPRAIWGRLAELFYSEKHDIAVGPNISQTAQIHASAIIENGVIIRAEALIGQNCILGANSYIGPGVIIGEGTTIGPNAVITHAAIGSNCSIGANSRLGNNSISFEKTKEGIMDIKQFGTVVLGNNVQVGCLTFIDRGTIGSTSIGEGTRIGSSVAIAHNVQVGERCVIISQTAIAGSAVIGADVMIGGQSGIGNNVEVGNGAAIAAQSGVITDVPAGMTVGGSPAVDIKSWHKQTLFLKNNTSQA